MLGNRIKRRPRAFQPAIDNPLESRFLLAHSVHHARPVPAALHADPPKISVQVANGGRAAIIHDVDGAVFEVTLTSTLQGTGPQITAGTVLVTPGPGGTVNITAMGTNVDSDLAINPVLRAAKKGKAHNFGLGIGANDQLLHVNNINVVSGQIGLIEGFHSAVLQGAIVVAGKSPVSRIAFAAIQGGTIIVGGDLNTLDVIGNIDFTGGLGLAVGGDLNWFDTSGNLTIAGNSNFKVGRDIGLFPQPAKGTGPAGQGGFVLGNVTVAPGSTFTVGRSIDAPVLVEGNFSGASRVSVGVGPVNIQVRGTITP
ncbi:MAG TPA: hypothetical protein VGY53_09655 [Isosphaeraceae bacterium]|nr:hypothetical protein [Isosphaeraceae bacterium]